MPSDISFLVFEDDQGFYRLEGVGPIEARVRVPMTKEEADAWVDMQYKRFRTLQDTELERLAKRLHQALNDVIAMFVHRGDYGKYILLDDALDVLADSSKRLGVPLSAGIAKIIEDKKRK